MTPPLTVDRRAVLAYLRLGGTDPEGALLDRLAAVERAVLAAARPRAYWRLEPVAFAEDGSYTVGPLHLCSRDLARHLAGCRHAYLFCATLGADVDALARRYSLTSAADALLAQAVGSALIETYCESLKEELLAEPAVAGERLHLRYAPGYGDLPLETQRELLAVLDSTRRAGIVLTDGLLMIPSKSISAIWGVGPGSCAVS